MRENMPSAVSIVLRDVRTTAQSVWHGPIVASANESAAVAFAHLQPPVRWGLPPQRLQRVRQYVEAHLNERIRIQMLAGLAGLSIYHFARAFKRSEGLTPHEYIVRRRVQYAQNLLANSDMPLAEIAVAAGFSDQSHCARRFREHVGVTPSSYRWSMR
jgi:AraC-like DNA-binding protein